MNEVEFKKYVLMIIDEFKAEFEREYGEKYLSYLGEQLDFLIPKVRLAFNFDGQTSAAIFPRELVYIPNGLKILPIMKHEIWHWICHSGHIETPDNYREHLQNNEQFFQTYNVHGRPYGRFIHSIFDQNEDERWTEWFASNTAKKDFEQKFIPYNRGFFFTQNVEGTTYSWLLQAADIVSCLIPKEKILQMRLNNPQHDTFFSFNDYVREFDNMYAEALTPEEKQTFKYPYLKVILENNQLENSVQSDMDMAFEISNQMISFLFRAYLIKLDKIEKIDEVSLRNVYNEIKFMQSRMPLNVNSSRLEGLEYIHVMEVIQDKFIEMCSGFPQLEELKSGVNYKLNLTPLKLYDGSDLPEILFEKHDEKEKTTRNKELTKEEIQKNLYVSLKIALGTDIYKYAFKEFCGENEYNPLLDIATRINNLKSMEEVDSIYSKIYGIMNEKIGNIKFINTLRMRQGYTDLIALKNYSIKRVHKLFKPLEKSYAEKVEATCNYVDFCVRQEKEKNDRSDSSTRANEYKKKICGWLEDISINKSEADVPR